MKKILLLIAPFVLASKISLAGTTVIEGEEAKKIFEANKATAKVLAQKDKVFILRMPDGTETEKPEAMNVKAGEQFFLTNEEEKYVHNVYDDKESSWVLKKQEPSQVAAITFSDPGEHKLRCAIHPKMKIKVIVE